MVVLQTKNFRNTSRNGLIRRLALAGAGVTALSLVMAQAAFAQEVAQADAGAAAEEVTVTGTRVVRDGYNAPTPVTVLSTEAIDQSAPSNLANFVNQMPAVANSTTPDNSSAAVSSGGAGVNALNLRGLGTQRTLVLLDGHRSAPSTTTGQVDINTIPQELVQRVDIVTGGASADYGSDAVGGVINFVLNKTYTGFKGDLEYGQTTDGLQPSYKAALTYGADFGGGRGHILLSGEWVNQAPINNYVPDWEKNNYYRLQNPAYVAGNGQPYYLVTSHVVPSEVTPGGIIVSGPLQGTYFGSMGANGQLATGQLAYGAVSGPYMVGGDQTTTMQNFQGTQSLAVGEIREGIYTRASYNLTDDIEVYGELSINRYKGYSWYQQPSNYGGVTIKSDNAFLPQSIRTTLANDNLSQITIGTTNSGYPEAATRNGREAQRVAFGADGTVNLLTQWKWDLHGQIGISDTREQVFSTWNTSRLNLANDAVFAPAGNALGVAAGTIVCRSSLTNPTNGCQPLSRIGVNGGLQSPADFQKGIAYVFDNPYRLQRLSEQSYSFNVTGTPFDNWQGPVSVAFGGEWRLEAVNGFVPTQYQSGWNYGNYLVNHGHYSVGEGYLETVVPVLPGLDFNGAVRYTAYSTSGGVTTWKTGATYAPSWLLDVKLRVTYSHDIRAPNLDELFAAGTARTNSVLINNTAYTYTQRAFGNPNLSPESANSLGAGVVITPTFLDGFTASVDYFNITVAKAIGSLQPQTVADLCYKSFVQSYCNDVIYASGVQATPYNAQALTAILLQPFNFAKQKMEGIDFDVTYDVPLDRFSNIPGGLRLNALATNYMRDYTNDGVDPPADVAGVNYSGGIPSWSYRVSATYNLDPWTFFIVGRGISDGVYANEYVQCSTSCPLSTVAHYTINNNHIDGAFYVDTTITYDFTAYNVDSQVFLSIKNLFDTSPVLIGNGPSGSTTPAATQTNINLYDYLGRVFRIGVRFKT